jgi:signal transduction histidine kinase
VNRALVLTFVTVIVAGGYVLVVVALGRILSGGGNGFWPSLLATTAVAIAFQPLRTRVISLADRMAFGTAAAPYEALAEFSRQLGGRPGPEQLLPAMAQAAGQAVNARHATVHLRMEHGPERSARWPLEAIDDVGESCTQVPIVDRGQLLGLVTVAMAPGHPLRARQHQLIGDLAQQAALVFRNAHLAAELADQVSELRGHTEELAQSRRRLITAADAERQRLEQAIAGHVVPHLETLPSQLRSLSERAEAVGSEVAVLVESVNAALGSLREITRGVFPGQLSRSGLTTALRSLLARQKTPGQLAVAPTVAEQRFDPRLEAAGYFCVAELVDHMDGPVFVSLGVEAGRLALQVSGTHQLPTLRRGQMTDRIEATGGSVLLSRADGRSLVQVSLPLTLS